MTTQDLLGKIKIVIWRQLCFNKKMNLLITFVQSLFAAFFLWFGLYIISRRKSYLSPLIAWWNDPSFSIGLLMMLASWQLFGVAMRSEALTSSNFLSWVKATWWVSPISVFLWFYSSFLIFKANIKKIQSIRYFWLFVIPLGILGGALAGFGTFTEWIFVFSKIYPNPANLANPYTVPPGWGAILYVSYQVFLSFISLFLIALAKKQSRREHILQSALHLVLIGNFFGAIGVTMIVASGLFFNLLIPEQVGDFLLTIGFILIAVGVVQYNASIQKRIPYTDLWRSLGGVGIASLFYVFFIELFLLRYGKDPAEHAAILSLMIYLTTLIHTPLEWGQTLLNRMMPFPLMPDWEKEYLKIMDQFQYDILTTPDPQITLENVEKELHEAALHAHLKELRQLIFNEIEAIFRHKGFENDLFLAQSKLSKLQIVSTEAFNYAQNRNMDVHSLTFSDQAEILRIFLTDMVSLLCNHHPSSPAVPLSANSIECLIMQEKYINNKSRKEVEAAVKEYGYLLSGGAYSRYLQNGRKLLSELIFKKEFDLLTTKQEKP